MIDSSFGQIRK